MTVITKYASTVEVLTDTRWGSEEWSNLPALIGSNGVTGESYTGTRDGKKFHPKELYAHDFDLDIPSTAKINSLRVEISVGCDFSVDVENPYCNIYYANGNPTGVYVEYKGHSTVHNSTSKMAHYDQIVQYNEDSIYLQTKVTPELISRDIFGCIFTFKEPISGNGRIWVDWVRITVDYTAPEYVLIGNDIAKSTIDAMSFYKGEVGTYFSFRFTLTNANGLFDKEDLKLKLELPFGLRLHSANASASNNGVTSFDSNTMEWHVKFTSLNIFYLELTCLRTTVGVKEIKLSSDWMGDNSWFTYNTKNGNIDHVGPVADDQVTITSTDVRRGAESTFYFAARTITPDRTVDFNIWTWMNELNKLVKYELDTTLSTKGVSINEENPYTSQFIEFNVPSGEDVVDIFFSITVIPQHVGEGTLLLEMGDSGNRYTYDYVSLEPYEYHISLISHDGVFKGGRLTSEIETGSYVLPCVTADYDRNNIISKPSLKAWKYLDIDYIGCVALEHTHYKPKSKFRDKLIENSYKNKKYMGKQGVIDEDITLNLKLHPSQVTTIQGLIGMDKPVPIDANHLCFEGDALNHRGWIELYGIETEEQNPHWYECELDVAYITHNINTRFKIEKGSKVSEYFLPNLLEDSHRSGDEIASYCDVSTTGYYEYDPDAELDVVSPTSYVNGSDTIMDSSITYYDSLLDFTRRNMVQLDNGQTIRFRTREPLNIKSIIAFNWDSTRLVTNAYNDLSRVIRLINKNTGHVVFEYEYYDVDYSETNMYPCRVIARSFYKGAYKTLINREMYLHSNVEYDASDSSQVDTYGSEIVFTLNGNVLTLSDKGLTGKEVYLDDIRLANGEYYFEVEFTNNNHVFNAGTVQNFFDLSVKELMFTSEYGQYYNQLLVSPFPIPDRKVIFTRECEDGTIFYVEDTGEEATYLLSPYYQYHCGVDLQSRSGISIFNLNNSYQTVYMTNGLVKLGINRINGKLTLFKYDKTTKSWILVSQLQLTKYDDININSFSDDKLELQASDTIFTMWRGRPFIQVKHQTEDILFSDKYTGIYGEGVGGSDDTYPKMWSLVDKTNLLDECVGSERRIKSKCLESEDGEIEDYDLTVELTGSESAGLANAVEYTASSSSPADYYLYVNGRVVGSLDNGATVFEHQYSETGLYKVQVLAIDAMQKHAFSNVLMVNVVDDYYRIKMDFAESMYFMEEDFKAILTLGGEPVEGETIVFNINGYAYIRETDSEGRARVNNTLPSGDYDVYVTYTDDEDGLIAYNNQKTKIRRGNVNFNLNKTSVNRGEAIVLTVTNNLDPNSDEVEENEQYVSKQAVVLHINGVAYPRITSTTGQASLTINLLPGTYDFRVVYAGDNRYYPKLANYEVIVT